MPKGRRGRTGPGHGQPCHWCGRRMLNEPALSQEHPLRATKDHVRARSRFHGEEPENIVMCCRACNMVKANMTLGEWSAFRAAFPRWWERYRYTKPKKEQVT